MLTDLHIKNFALIDEADIEFSDHLNILTGETGAGKSIVLGAIGLALGARTSHDAIKTGSDYCLSELTFRRLSDKVREKAQELDISIEDDELVIARKLSSSGKSVVRVNGELFSAASLRELTSLLIDIHGQNDHQSLLDNSKQLDIIDRFSGEQLEKLKLEAAELFEKYTAKQKELSALDIDDAALKREADLLRFQIDEIDAAELRDGEEEELKEEHKKLANAHVIAENLSAASAAIFEDGAAEDLISSAVKSLSRISGFDPKLEDIYNELSDIDSCLSDAYRTISDYLDEMGDDGERRAYVEERLDLISKLKNKYGHTVSEITEFRDRAEVRLERIMDRDEACDRLRKEISTVTSKLDELYRSITSIRRESAAKLDSEIVKGLTELNFNHVVFRTEIAEREGYSKEGPNTAQFLISLNPGEDVKPLKNIASGGEMSRIMLAIKAVMANKDEISTLIFDEIDTGISGITAQRVAEKMATISGSHQVISITHLPQIASMADEHFLIAKTADSDSTHVSITCLDDHGIQLELGRMLGGDELSPAILESALTIKRSADQKKIEKRKET